MNERAFDLARDFAGKANVCTHAGIISLAQPVFEHLEELLDDLKQLKCVVRAYDKVINELPIDEKIKFINKVPEHFREQAKTFIK